MKVLWISNSAQSTSAYGQQTALFLPRLRDAGHKVAVFAFTQSGGPSTTTDGFLQLPRLVHPFGNDIVAAHFNNTRSEVAISLIDPFALDPLEYARFPWCSWAPIDCEPAYPGTLGALKAARWIWAMSRFGERVLREAGLGDRVSYVPHGVDSKVFKPSDRTAARDVVANVTDTPLGGKFLVAMVAANKCRPARKGFFEAFKAFKAFSDSRPDTVLYLHSEMSSDFNGEDLQGVMDLVGLKRNRIAVVPQYPLLTGMLQPSYMSNVYNAADVFLSASHSEGFGIPLIEAQMCGCPVIAPRNTSQTELTEGFSGLQVNTTDYMSLGHTVWKRPSVQDMVDRLEHSYKYNEREKPRDVVKSVKKYDAENVFAEYMRPALEKIERDLSK